MNFLRKKRPISQQIINGFGVTLNIKDPIALWASVLRDILRGDHFFGHRLETVREKKSVSPKQKICIRNAKQIDSLHRTDTLLHSS